jgi:hypothetical protein
MEGKREGAEAAQKPVRKRRGTSGEEARRRECSVRWWTARSRQPAAGFARGSEGVAIRIQNRGRNLLRTRVGSPSGRQGIVFRCGRVSGCAYWRSVDGSPKIQGNPGGINQHGDAGAAHGLGLQTNSTGAFGWWGAGKCLKGLVDLEGFEPSTSSMPSSWHQSLTSIDARNKRLSRSLKYDQNLKPANVKSTTCAYFFVTEQAISATC